MKKRSLLKPKYLITIFVVVVLLLIAYFIYSRPMTIQQRYPMLTLDKCTEIRGYYEVGAQAEMTAFTIEKDSEDFQKLCNLFYERNYRRSLRDILPRGTRIHRTEPEDFQWEVMFHFDTVEFPDGNRGSGTLLRIQHWYGDLDIHFDGEMFSCYTNEQEAWAKEVIDAIQ